MPKPPSRTVVLAIAQAFLRELMQDSDPAKARAGMRPVANG